MSSCQKEEGTTSVDFADAPVSITTSLSETRATSDPDYTGTSLSLSIINSTSSYYSYYGTKWAFDSSDSEWDTTETVLWRNSTTAVAFYAFAPYSTQTLTSASSFEAIASAVETDQTTAANVTASDFVAYSNTSYTPSSSTTIAIPFAHKLSKFNISLTFGDEFGDTTPTVTSVKVNAKNNFSYNFSTDAAAGSGDATAITAYAVTANTSYSVILPPQTISSGNLIEVEISGKSYALAVGTSSYIFEQGKEYSISIRVGKDVTVVGSVTVGDWTPADAFTAGDAELVQTN